ncbi:MAG: cysteine hydrolase [Firmicutes bacterium]|nr:cysteine hydrolase [Bacillota bacterium]
MNWLVVVDMQNDFISGSLGSAEARGIVERVAAKILKRRDEGWQTVYTRDSHGPDYLCSQEGRRLPVEHCIKGTNGHLLDSRIPVCGTVLDKPSFGSVELARHIAGIGAERIELIGLCTDICVISNALLLKAFLPEAEISVDASCCAGVTPQSHLNALEAMKMCQIEITGQQQT